MTTISITFLVMDQIMVFNNGEGIFLIIKNFVPVNLVILGLFSDASFKFRKDGGKNLFLSYEI